MGDARAAVRLGAALLAIVALVAGVWVLLRAVQTPEHPAAGARQLPVTEQARSVPGPVRPPQREVAESASYGPVDAGSFRTVRVVVVSGYTGDPIAGADVRLEPLDAAFSGITDAGGELELELPFRPLLLSAEALGYAPNSAKLESAEHTVQVALHRAQPLSGWLELSNGRAPTERPTVVAYPLAADLDQVQRAIEKGERFPGPGLAVHHTRAEADGSFFLVGLCEGRNYGLAVFGSGLVATARGLRVTAGDSGVRVQVAYVFGAFVRAVDQLGQPVPLFEPTTYKQAELTWRPLLTDARGALVWTLPASFHLSGWPHFSDRARGFGRMFLATAAEPIDVLTSLEIDVHLPGYQHHVVAVQLPRIDRELPEKTVELWRVAPCLGTLRVRFSVSDPHQIPEATITLIDAAGARTQSNGVPASHMLPDRSFRIHNLPCGAFGFVFKSSVSSFTWPPPAEPHRIVIEADKETVVEVPVDGLGAVMVELQGSALEAFEGRVAGGGLLRVVPEEMNKGRDLKQGFTYLMALPVSRPQILIPGLSVGRYALLYATNELKGLVWVDAEAGVTKHVQIGE